MCSSVTEIVGAVVFTSEWPLVVFGGHVVDLLHDDRHFVVGLLLTILTLLDRFIRTEFGEEKVITVNLSTSISNFDYSVEKIRVDLFLLAIVV